MERDALISYGASGALQDRTHFNSDRFEPSGCMECEMSAEKNCLDNRQKYQSRVDWNTGKPQYFCRNCDTGDQVRDLTMPYGCKLFAQEIMACGVKVQMDP